MEREGLRKKAARIANIILQRECGAIMVRTECIVALYNKLT